MYASRAANAQVELLGLSLLRESLRRRHFLEGARGDREAEETRERAVVDESYLVELCDEYKSERDEGGEGSGEKKGTRLSALGAEEEGAGELRVRGLLSCSSLLLYSSNMDFKPAVILTGKPLHSLRYLSSSTTHLPSSSSSSFFRRFKRSRSRNSVRS